MTKCWKNTVNDDLKAAIEDCTIALDENIFWFVFSSAEDPRAPKVTVAVAEDGAVYIPAGLLNHSRLVVGAAVNDVQKIIETKEGDYFVPIVWARANFPVLAPLFDHTEYLLRPNIEKLKEFRKTGIPPETTLH